MSVPLRRPHNATFWTPREEDGFAKLGKNVRIHPHCVIPNCGAIEIGDNVRIDAFTVLSARKIVIGPGVVIHSGCVLSGAGTITLDGYNGISHGCKFFTTTDDMRLADHSVASDDRVITGNIHLERHATVCSDVTVLPNVRLGFASYVGALSLVKQDMPRMCIAGGVPAHVLKLRDLSENDFRDFEKRCEERHAHSAGKTDVSKT